MTDAIKKLREPAALAAAAFAALSVLASVIELLFTSGGSFSDTAAGQTGNLLSFPVALALAIAVYLANHVGPALEKARLITLVSLAAAAVAAVFGLVSFFAGFGADDSGTDKFAYFLAGAGGAAALGVAAWYVWLTWQTHAPARPAEPVPPVGGVGGQPGWGAPQGQPGMPGQQQPGGGLGGQQPGAPGAPQGQQPAGFGWTPGNPNEQTAYLPPQQAQAQPGPQTLHAQQSASGSFSIQQPGQPGAAGQGQPGQQQAQPGYAAPQQPTTGQQYEQPQQPYEQQQYGAPQAQPGMGGQPQQAPQQQGGGDRTQMMPPVPSSIRDYAPDPQPWQPAGPGGAQVPPQQAPHPMNQGDPQAAEPERNDGRQGPFGVGNWQ